MSIAAEARARAVAAVAAAASADAGGVGKAPPRARPVRTSVPDVATTAQASGRASPAQQRRAWLIASSAGGILAAAGVQLSETGGNDNSRLQGEAARVLTQLQEDRHRLKAIQSIEKKIALKRSLLPAYAGWCDGVLAAGRGERGPLDELFTTIMAWRIDVGDYLEALPMLEHVLRHDLPMPERFSRTAAAFAVEQVSEAAIRAYEAGGDVAAAFPAAVLPLLQDLITATDADIHDEVSAKLQRALGLAIMAGAVEDDADDLRARQEQTLKCYQRALELNPRVGVKKQIESLQAKLKKGPPPTAQTAEPDPPPPPAGDG